MGVGQGRGGKSRLLRGFLGPFTFTETENRERPLKDPESRDPQVIGGKPCVRGMRVTVGMIVGQIAAGHTIDEVLAEYPYLEREDVLQSLRLASTETVQRS